MGFRILSDDEITRLSEIAPDIHPGRMVISGEFVYPLDYITDYSPGVWEQLNPQPVNLTPGALGVRCEE